MLPSITGDGKLLLTKKHEIAMNPNGHGGVLESFYKSDVFQTFMHKNVKYLSYFQVDNIQAKFEDPYFIGLHIDADSEFSSKIVEKTDPVEKVGLFVKIGNDLRIIEYSDLPEQYQILRNADDSLRFNAANVAIHLIDMSFMLQLVESDVFSLPYHVANKAILCIDVAGELTMPTTPNAYKFEKFIFDALDYAKNPIIMQVHREEEFLPLKNAEGLFSPDFIRQCYQDFWAEKLEEIGMKIVRKKNGNLPGKIEIDPAIILTFDDLKCWVDSHELKSWNAGNLNIM
ncbi:MAG: UTP--glucose-1-phosphate uridylyltransferase [Planctomycetes bacterium]|nr:UTP--glucose-1-phosphate uridylyltransferase [Planctomycetota bacterium]